MMPATCHHQTPAADEGAGRRARRIWDHLCQNRRTTVMDLILTEQQAAQKQTR
jgi:hypothetical protein